MGMKEPGSVVVVVVDEAIELRFVDDEHLLTRRTHFCCQYFESFLVW